MPTRQVNMKYTKVFTVCVEPAIVFDVLLLFVFVLFVFVVVVFYITNYGDYNRLPHFLSKFDVKSIQRSSRNIHF